MQRYRVLVALLGLALATSMLLAVAAGSQVPRSPIHSVAQVQAGLADHPQAWLQRTVPVRAIAEPCPWWGAAERLRRCAGRPLVLAGTSTDAPADPLPLIRPAPQPLLTRVRRLPVLGTLLPQAPGIPLFTLARFRIRLLASPAGSGAGCYEALLLDAAPAALLEA
jgi:hypothetical protein